MINNEVIKKAIGLLLVLGLLYTPSIAFADQNKIQKRLKTQSEKIKKGVKLGQLTSTEKTILTKEQRAIKNTLTKMMSDKKLSPSESKKLNALLDKASLKIYDLRYNKDRTK